MFQFFSKPDRYLARTGDLRCGVSECRIEDAPSFMRGLRAVFISDTHAVEATTADDLERFVRRVIDLRPDLLLLGGDYADRAEPALRLIQALGRVRAPLGAYAAVGNNDREAFEDLEVLRRAMAESGIVLLVNGSRALRVGGGRLFIAGVDEYRRGAPNADGLYPAAAPDVYRILLSHYPRDVAVPPDLMLCGHTHGGQFNALGVTPYTIGFERVIHHKRASRYIAGLHARRGGWVLVSKGIGGSRIPLRVGVRPEMNVIEF